MAVCIGQGDVFVSSFILIVAHCGRLFHNRNRREISCSESCGGSARLMAPYPKLRWLRKIDGPLPQAVRQRFGRFGDEKVEKVEGQSP